jgi:heme-degrading monooxygenase HmoA
LTGAREKAFSEYGCLGFTSACEDDREIAISYWPSMQHIRNWKEDPLHRRARQRGREKWYSDFSVEICELIRRGPA